MHNDFRKTNAINMKFFMKALAGNTKSKSKNLVVIQFIRYHNFSSKIGKKT